jgi:hypothetical protein
MDAWDIGSLQHASDHTIAVCCGEKILLRAEGEGVPADLPIEHRVVYYFFP